LLALRPTIFPSVPRLLNRLHDVVWSKASQSGAIQFKALKSSVESKVKGLAKGELTSKVLDHMVFGPIKSSLGLDKVRLMLTGSAPITDKVLQFFRAVLSVPVIEGFGQTEGTVASTMTFQNDFSVGHVGGPVPANEITLFDVPELGYLSTDTVHNQNGQAIKCIGRGEIGVRGTNVMKGYYKQPELTANAIDIHGWLHTGDIGIFLENGALKIVDRKKNIFKLSQGEYVAPDKLESIYRDSQWISQIFVHGDPVESSIVAIIVLDMDLLPSLATKMGLDSKNLKALFTNPKVREAVASDMEKLAVEHHLNSIERVKAFYIETEPFTIENDLMTPTFKLKRKILLEKYRSQIDRLYASLKAREATH